MKVIIIVKSVLVVTGLRNIGTENRLVRNPAEISNSKYGKDFNGKGIHTGSLPEEHSRSGKFLQSKGP